MVKNQFEKVAVLGAGIMGHGIAQIAAVAGFNVVIRDISQELLAKAKNDIERSLRRFVERGRMTEEAAKSTMWRISTTLDISEAVGDADLVIEAIPERARSSQRTHRA